MQPRERVLRTLEFRQPDRAPRDLWALPGVVNNRQEEYESVLNSYPPDIQQAGLPCGRSLRSRGTPFEVGSYVDEWGCEFDVAEPGVCGEVKNPPLTDWTALADWQPPWEMLEEVDTGQVNRWHDETDRFLVLSCGIRPFERMQFLRGTENLFMDFAWQPQELFQLRDMLHEYNLKSLRFAVETDADGISFMDDWGTQRSLLISPKLWESFFKPMYREYCEIIRAAGKKVFFHSDGHIQILYPHLIEIGIDAVNSQLFCMDIEEIGRQFQGKISFWGEIDRQQILPFGTVEEVRQAVRRVRKALDNGQGGLIAQCEWGLKDPKENIEAVFETWLEE